MILICYTSLLFDQNKSMFVTYKITLKPIKDGGSIAGGD
jgi:hypothetical protein